MKSNKVLTHCAHCGKEILRVPSRIQSYKAQYCCQRCNYDHRKIVGNGRALRRDHRICVVCGKEFSIMPCRKDTMCSQECRITFCKTTLADRKKNRVKDHCLVCGREIERKPHQIASGRDKYCSHKCAQTAIKRWREQNKPWNWKGGKDTEKERMAQTSRLRHQRKRAYTDNPLTIAEWETIKKDYNYTCPSCNKKEPLIKLTIDHRIPISKGGLHTKSNIQPLCASCNSKKYTKLLFFYPNGMKVDFLKLINYVANHSEYEDLIMFNSSVGNNKAKSMGKEINNIPGLSYYEE